MLRQVARRLETEGFDVQVSDDGRRFIARKFSTKPAEEAKAEEVKDENIIRILPISPTGSKQNVNEFYAEIANFDAQGFEDQAEIKLKKIGRLQKELADYEKQAAKLKKRRYIAKKATPVQIIILGLVGFVLGVVLAVSQLLENHGPTVTLWGTIGASAIYLFSGIFWMLFFGGLGRAQAREFVDDYDTRLKEYEAAANAVREKIAELQADADALRSAARKSRFKAWRYGGIV